MGIQPSKNIVDVPSFSFCCSFHWQESCSPFTFFSPSIHLSIHIIQYLYSYSHAFWPLIHYLLIQVSYVQSTFFYYLICDRYLEYQDLDRALCRQWESIEGWFFACHNFPSWLLNFPHNLFFPSYKLSGLLYAVCAAYPILYSIGDQRLLI